jgi:molybdopterin-containing oxidoreductase family iron-sulfur binding subunit
MSDERYWKSHAELEDRAVRSEHGELEESIFESLDPVDRRGFLKASGFSLAGALMLGCSRGSVDKAIPYLVQPEEIVPGHASWYATTCEACSARCGALIKTRDGRPIKLEGNREHAYSVGGLCAVGQASVLGLYDSQRLPGAQMEGRPATWSEVDRAIDGRISEVLAAGGRVRLLSDTVTSLTEKRLIDRFLGQFVDAKHVVYDPLSGSAILDAHQATHGKRLLPRYDFEQAEVIVSFGADFLGTWISPVEFTAAYHRGRRLDGDTPRLSHHTQFEGRMSLTGSNADLRARLDPADAGLVLSHLVQKIAALSGGAAPEFGLLPAAPVEDTLLNEVAARLWQARGRALVVSGSQSQDEQVLVNYLNEMLGAYGATLDLERPSWQLQGDDRALAELIAEIREGSVDLLLIRGVNPVYDLPGAELAEGLARLPFVVSLAGSSDETAAVAKVICPEPHFLEAWRDAEAVAGVVSVTQPAIQPLNETRTLAESLSAWSGDSQPALDLIQEIWREEVFPRASTSSFQKFWDQTVHDGSTTLTTDPVEVSLFDVTAARPLESRVEAGTLTLEIYPKIALRDGRHAHNPWLQELPDPITKVVWDNYACLSPQTAQRLGVEENDVVRLEIDGEPALELPVYVQPGQHDQVVSVALGYGRTGTDRFAGVAPQWLQGKPTIEAGATVGKNVAPLTTLDRQGRRFVRAGLRVTPTGTTQNLASTQTYNYLSVPAALAPTTGQDRPIIQETVLPDYVEDRAAGAPHLHHFDSDLWGQHEFTGHHWAMAIDLTACTGCSACVISCQAENNVPVVGRDEVERRRDMQWIRIDRYYRGAEEDPDTVHQPMMCHHCDNAPCETVCPVYAGLQSMRRYPLLRQQLSL